MPSFLKRFLISLPTLWGISVLAFMLMHMAPGNPASLMLDPKLSIQDQQHLIHNLGLDQPLWKQYSQWLLQICQGNWGTSYVSGKPVLTAIAERMPATLILSISSLFFTLLLTLPLGLWAGYKKGRFFDKAFSILSLIGMAIPTFWLGLVCILIFSVKFNWLPTSGFLDPGMESASFIEKTSNISQHLVLPLVAILVGSMAGLTRYYRSETITVLSQDYIQAARARGFSERRILYKHVLKNALLPIVTILGLTLPELISGAFVIEYIFSWPGMGQLGISAVFSRDYPVLMGMLMMSSILIIAGNWLSDAAYRWVDPRVS